MGEPSIIYVSKKVFKALINGYGKVISDNSLHVYIGDNLEIREKEDEVITGNKIISSIVGMKYLTSSENRIEYFINILDVLIENFNLGRGKYYSKLHWLDKESRIIESKPSNVFLTSVYADIKCRLDDIIIPSKHNYYNGRSDELQVYRVIGITKRTDDIIRLEMVPLAFEYINLTKQ